MICGFRAVDAAQRAGVALVALRLLLLCGHSDFAMHEHPRSGGGSSFRTSSARRRFEIFRHEPLPADAPRTGDAPRTEQRANALHVHA